MSFIITIGAVDAAIGGLSEHWSLMTVGVGMIGMAVGMRLWSWQHPRPQPIREINRKAVHALPPSPTSSNLPPLSLAQKRPPGRS
jgi:hypothetical protein